MNSYSVQSAPVSARFSVEPRRSLNKSSVIITNYKWVTYMTQILGTKLPKGIATADMTSHHLLTDGERKGSGNKQKYNSVKNEMKSHSVSEAEVT